MVYSMTGFAAINGAQEGFSWTIEMRGVNAKGLDLRLRLPERMSAQEQQMRAMLSKRFARGNISVSLRLETQDAFGTVGIDDNALDVYLLAAIQVRAAARDKGLKLETSTATDFLALRGVMVSGEDTLTEPPVEPIMISVHEAIDAFEKMRRSEGAALSKVLKAQLVQISDLTQQAAELAHARQDKMAQTLKDNLAKVLANSDGADPDRVAQELAILAVKADVTEELDRLRAHIDAARELLGMKGPIGRKLDFLMQEFNREANTLCSKSGAADLTRVGLDLKAVIDQMREQVQNVE